MATAVRPTASTTHMVVVDGPVFMVSLGFSMRDDRAARVSNHDLTVFAEPPRFGERAFDLLLVTSSVFDLVTEHSVREYHVRTKLRHEAVSIVFHGDVQRSVERALFEQRGLRVECLFGHRIGFPVRDLDSCMHRDFAADASHPAAKR